MVDRKNEGKAKRFTDQRRPDIPRLVTSGIVHACHMKIYFLSFYPTLFSGLDFDKKKGEKTRGATVK